MPPTIEAPRFFIPVSERHPSQRVVITGLGAITPLGLDVPSTWEALKTGNSGVDYIMNKENWDSRVNIAAEIKGSRYPAVLTPKERKRIHESAFISSTAVVEALVDARLLTDGTLNIPGDDIGIRCGTGAAGVMHAGSVQQIIDREGDKAVRPDAIMKILPERVVTVPGMKYGFNAETAVSIAACASSGQAIVDAYRALVMGDAKVMVAGGAEAATCRITIAGFAGLTALSESQLPPSLVSRPFDKKATGFVLGEGAVMMTLETLEYALARKASIYAEMVGYGVTADAEFETAPNKIGSGKAMKRALERARFDPRDLDLIMAHATSTKIGDAAEAEVIGNIIGKDNNSVSISASKSMLAHLLGASGASKVMIAVLAMRDGFVPPTINIEDPINNLLDFTPNIGRARVVDTALINSFGFGGLNVSLALKSFCG